MQHISLVGIRAVDITEALGKHGMFQFTSYNKPIATVIPVSFESRREFYSAIETIAKELFDEQKANE